MTLAALATLALACAIAIAVSGPARAFPTTASFTATDFEWAVSGGGTATTVHIDPGGTVNFGYPSGSYAHNADFGGAAPSSCTQTGGTNSGSVPPLPASPAAAGWTGNCLFNTVGTYTFHCDLHPSMHGTVLVGDVPEPPLPTGGSGGGGGGTGGTQTGGGNQSGPLAGLRISNTQRGTKVSGSITDVVAGSAVTIDVTAKSSALKTSATKSVRVARLSKSAADAGALKFAIKVNKKARAAIRKNGSLRLTVKVKLTPPGASAATATKSVKLKKP